MSRSFSRGFGLALVLLAATFGSVAAQADTLYLGRANPTLDAANRLPFDQALGLNVTIPKLDATNDEVATGASAGQTGAISKYRLLSTATGFDAAAIKGSAGRFYGIAGLVNIDDSTRFVKIYDKATAPDPSNCTAGNSDCPVFTFILSPQSVALGTQIPGTFIPGGVAMTNGIGIVCVALGGDTNETACQANFVAATVLYKSRPPSRSFLLSGWVSEPCKGARKACLNWN